MRRVSAAAAVAAALACLSACGGGSSDDAPAQAAVAPVVAEVPQALENPFAWEEVPYAVYLEAADQLAIRPDVLTSAATFIASLGELCTTPTTGFTQLRQEQLAFSGADATDQGTAQYLRDETSLRITLACPQRMSDWISVPEAESAADVAAEEAEAAAEATTGEQLGAPANSETAFTESSYPDSAPAGGYSERTGDTTAAP